MGIFIPVRPYFRGMRIASVDGPMEVFMDIWRAEEKICNKWHKYEQRVGQDEVGLGQLLCTFVLKPMMADFNDCMICPEMTETAGEQQPVVLAVFALVTSRSGSGKRCTGKKKVLGQLMKAVFDTSRRQRAITSGCR